MLALAYGWNIGILDGGRRVNAGWTKAARWAKTSVPWVESNGWIPDPLGNLEDHPMTCKWLITMVIVGPLTGVVGPLPNGLYKWLINGGY